MTENGIKDDYQALIEMAREKTAAGRAALADAIGDLFSDGNEVLTDLERALMTDILRRIVHEAEMPVRRELAETLTAREDVPRRLPGDLANDEVEIAYPILLRSTLLRDPELVEAIRHRTLQHQLAGVMRRAAGESITEALAGEREEDPIQILLDHPDARVSKFTRDYLVDQAKRVDSYQNPLLRLAEVDPVLAKRLHWWVSAAVRQYAVALYGVDPTMVDAVLDRAVKRIAEERDAARTETAHAALAGRLAETDAIESELMIKVLRQGEISLFEALLARLSGLRLRLLRRILFEVGGEALAVICRSIPMPKADFATIFQLTRKARPSEPPVSPLDLSRVLELYDRIRPESASAIVGRWRSDPDYLNAVRILSDLDIGATPDIGVPPAPSGDDLGGTE